MIMGRALAILLLCAGTAQGQAVTVVDAATGSPVPGALVEWGTEESAVTNGDGAFESLGPRAPDVVYRVRAIGYEMASVTWNDIAEGQRRVSLEPTAIPMDELVVTATGRPVRRSEVAVPIETMGEVELRAGSAPAVDRLLSGLPSIQQTGAAPTGTNLMIRGIGGSRVLVLLDGQPAGGALLENRDVSRMSLAGVSQVEVVKGPLSSLYGSDALGGVINLVTRPPRDGFQADASVLAGGSGRTEAHATAEGGGDGFRYRVTGSWRQEDRVPGLAGGTDAFARVWDLRGTGRGEWADWRYRADASLVRERQRWPVGGGFSGFNDNTGVSGWSQLERDAGPGAVAVRIFGQSYDHLYRSARGDLPFESNGDETQTERLIRLTASYSLALGEHALDLGTEASVRRIRSPDKILADEASDNQIEVYAQNAWRVGSTTITGGTRGTFNDRWGSTASPTLGISHALGTSFRLRGSLSRGFRAPSFKELTWNFANLGAGYTVLGNDGLEPERSWSASGGLEWIPSQTLSVGIEAYRTGVRNLIESSFQGYTPSGLLIYSPRNVSRARTRGGELTVRAIGDGWDLNAGYAYLDAQSVDLALPLDRRASHSARVRSSWNLRRAARMDATLHYTGSAPIIGIDETGATARVGTQGSLLGLNLQATAYLPGNLEATLGVDNLLDDRPEGWPATVQRQVRIGIAARDLFAR